MHRLSGEHVERHASPRGREGPKVRLPDPWGGSPVKGLPLWEKGYQPLLSGRGDYGLFSWEGGFLKKESS